MCRINMQRYHLFLSLSAGYFPTRLKFHLNYPLLSKNSFTFPASQAFPEVLDRIQYLYFKVKGCESLVSLDLMVIKGGISGFYNLILK